MATRIRPLAALRPLRGKSIGPRMPADVTAGRKRVPDIIEAQVAGRKVWPEIGRQDQRPCIRKSETTLRKCHVELVFLGDRLATERKVRPGAYVQLCTKFGSPGTLVPVADHTAAGRVADAYCACRRRGKPADACERLVRGRR